MLQLALFLFIVLRRRCSGSRETFHMEKSRVPPRNTPAAMPANVACSEEGRLSCSRQGSSEGSGRGSPRAAHCNKPALAGMRAH